MMTMEQMEREKSYYSTLYLYASDLYYASHVNRDPEMLKEEIQHIQKRIIERFGIPQTIEN